MSVERNPEQEAKRERWKRSFFTIDNKPKPLAFYMRTEELKKTVAIYDRRKHCPRRIFVAVMFVADRLDRDSAIYRALRFMVMTRGK